MLAYGRSRYIQEENTNVPDVAKAMGLINTQPEPGGPGWNGLEFDTGPSANTIRHSVTNTLQLKDDFTTTLRKAHPEVWNRGHEQALVLPNCR
jgi:hypothetical protein